MNKPIVHKCSQCSGKGYVWAMDEGEGFVKVPCYCPEGSKMETALLPLFA